MHPVPYFSAVGMAIIASLQLGLATHSIAWGSFLWATLMVFVFVFSGLCDTIKNK